MASITIRPSGQACGAEVDGLDLSKPLDAATLAEVKAAWLEHHVLSFPNQQLNGDQLEAFAQQFGGLGEDPFFNPIPGRKHIAAVKREAEDTNPIFAEYWHSDWSFMPEPPCGTVLYALDIPPHGGDTEFSNQHLSFESMPQEMKARFDGLRAIHSPKLGYSLKGVYGDVNNNGAMDIRPSEEAERMHHTHPLAPAHPETGRRGFLSGVSYIVGFEGLSDEEARPLIMALNEWQSREEFMYRHKWESNMLVLWDNRSVVHRATGGYEGYRRELLRVTVY
ncbi:MAG: TauD/TfdA family dioxygenase [Chloroflexota bacterium]|nr:TauD/TfdA family dioxygenase [Chloroflexota bacterium]